MNWSFPACCTFQCPTSESNWDGFQRPPHTLHTGNTLKNFFLTFWISILWSTRSFWQSFEMCGQCFECSFIVNCNPYMVRTIKMLIVRLYRVVIYDRCAFIRLTTVGRGGKWLPILPNIGVVTSNQHIRIRTSLINFPRMFYCHKIH